MLIQIRDLSKTYITPAGVLVVLNGVNLTIKSGEFVTLVGASGSGKTTLLNVITGVDQPTSGQVIVGDTNVTHSRERRLTRWRGRNIGIIFQQFQLLPTLSVLDNVVMPMDFCGVYKPRERRERALHLLDQLGIAQQANKTPDMLSGGQQQRVAIARALANDPQLIIADEPTANLDRMSAEIVFGLFQELTTRGRSIVMVTHDREVVRGMNKTGKTTIRTLGLGDGRIEDLLDSAILRRSQVFKRSTQEFKRATQELHAANLH